MSARPVVTGDSLSTAPVDSSVSSATALPELPMLSDSLQSLEDLIEAVASKIPCNQEAPINQRHRRAFQKVMDAYFKNLESAFPYKKLETVYNRWVSDET